MNIFHNVKVNNYKIKIDIWENMSYRRYHIVTMR